MRVLTTLELSGKIIYSQWGSIAGPALGQYKVGEAVLTSVWPSEWTLTGVNILTDGLPQG